MAHAQGKTPTIRQSWGAWNNDNANLSAKVSKHHAGFIKVLKASLKFRQRIEDLLSRLVAAFAEVRPVLPGRKRQDHWKAKNKAVFMPWRHDWVRRKQKRIFRWTSQIKEWTQQGCWIQGEYVKYILYYRKQFQVINLKCLGMHLINENVQNLSWKHHV